MQKGMSVKQLRLLLCLFFLALITPASLLIYQAMEQMQWETFRQQQGLAEEFAQRVNRQLLELIKEEESFSFDDYSFLIVTGDPSANFLQPSQLSQFPVNASFQGAVGYFQIDSSDSFSTPLLPILAESAREFGISDSEIAARQSLQNEIRTILSKNDLVTGPGRQFVDINNDSEIIAQAEETFIALDSPDDSDTETNSERTRSVSTDTRVNGRLAGQRSSQSAFDQLNRAPIKKSAPQKQISEKRSGGLGRLEDLELSTPYEQIARSEPTTTARQKSKEAESRRPARREQVALAEPAAVSEIESDTRPPDVRISLFESEIDPFELALLDSGHFVLFRKVWREGERHIQGLLVESDNLINTTIHQLFRNALISQSANIAVAYQGNLLSAVSGAEQSYTISRADELRGNLLYQTRLSAPFNQLELVFTINRLPLGPGARVVIWSALIMLLVLCSGTLLLYRLGQKQLALIGQQQDFVSAVSHELKTPLTSIRMYGEMLKEGWAAETKKASYYEFIYYESERLSRLIENVLQLARMTRNELALACERQTCEQLIDIIQSKISTQVQQAGFELQIHCDDEVKKCVLYIDPDIFSQIIINLVDNALKFARNADKQTIEFLCQRLGENDIVFSIRDHGPGIEKNQMKRIFELFYRAEGELTRKTMGTGIGLALVYQLMTLMNGRVDAVNREPGAEFRLSFPMVKT